MNEQLAPPPISASVHIYRGLMDRAVSWRQRIDSPTNWAITTSGTVASFVLSDAGHPHVVLLLMMVLMYAFLIIEARRMRYYELWASWVRLLETDYFASILRDGQAGIGQPWQQLIVHDFANPHFKTPIVHLVARRLRDNYLLLLLFLLACWLVKLVIHPSGGAAGLVERASIGVIPGAAVFAAVLGSYVLLVLFTALYGRRVPNAELLPRELLAERMLAVPERLGSYQLRAALRERFLSSEDDLPLRRDDWD
ncbi:DUF2270 domain-containing protein [Chloroflexia bacterium SDU3-3]|nr:DUF2270 domain-containing protein [Chloroflexia bacterium SDU3-3]